MIVPTTARMENVTSINNFVRVLPATNIPFNVLNNQLLRKFFLDHVKSGVSLPKGSSLNPYLEDCYKVDREKLTNNISQKPLLILFDETTDTEGRFVCNIIFATLPPKEQSLELCLADTIFEDVPSNHDRNGQIVIDVLQNFFVEYSNVMGTN